MEDLTPMSCIDDGGAVEERNGQNLDDELYANRKYAGAVGTPRETWHILYSLGTRVCATAEEGDFEAREWPGFEHYDHHIPLPEFTPSAAQVLKARAMRVVRATVRAQDASLAPPSDAETGWARARMALAGATRSMLRACYPHQNDADTMSACADTEVNYSSSNFERAAYYNVRWAACSEHSLATMVDGACDPDEAVAYALDARRRDYMQLEAYVVIAPDGAKYYPSRWRDGAWTPPRVVSACEVAATQAARKGRLHMLEELSPGKYPEPDA